MNLSPGGLEEGPPGFPYFATADGKFEFGYGPPFHHDAPFFHPPPAMPFNQPGWYRFFLNVNLKSYISHTL